MSEPTRQEDCIDALGGFLEHYGGDPRVHIMGGIGVAALTDPDTRIFYGQKRIEVSDKFSYPLLRENKSRRDADVFVHSTNMYELRTVKHALTTALDGRLKPSLFGVHSAAELAAAGHSPLGGPLALGSYLSERYASPDGTMVKAIFPFVAPVDEESLEPWKLAARGYEFNVPNPAIAAVNYMNRSISGIRARDSRKAVMMMTRFHDESPEMIDYIVHGPGKSQFELARVMHAAGVGVEPLNEVLGNTLAQEPLTPEEIAGSPLLEYADLSSHQLKFALGAFAFKAQAVRYFEGIKWVHKVWQKSFEGGIAKRFVGDV